MHETTMKQIIEAYKESKGDSYDYDIFNWYKIE